MYLVWFQDVQCSFRSFIFQLFQLFPSCRLKFLIFCSTLGVSGSSLHVQGPLESSEDCTFRWLFPFFCWFGLVRWWTGSPRKRSAKKKSLSHFNFFKSSHKDHPSSGVRHSNVQNHAERRQWGVSSSDQEVFRKSKPEPRIAVWRWPTLIAELCLHVSVKESNMLNDTLLLVSYHIRYCFKFSIGML